MEGGHNHDDNSMATQQQHHHHTPPQTDMIGQQGGGQHGYNVGYSGGHSHPGMYSSPQYGGWNVPGGWSQPGLNPGIPGVDCTDVDIVISTGLEHSRTREANLEYQRLLLANCVLFNCLPSHYQSVHAQHIYHFLTHVRGRRFLQCIAPNVYVPFNNGPYQIAQEISSDFCKMAFSSRNPCWLVDGLGSSQPPGDHTWVHRSNPRGNEWDIISMDRVRDLLKEEGPVHLLILPPGISVKSASEEKAVSTSDGVKKEDLGGHDEHAKVPPNPRKNHLHLDEEERGGGDPDTIPDDSEDHIIRAAEQAVEDAGLEDVDGVGEDGPGSHGEDSDLHQRSLKEDFEHQDHEPHIEINEGDDPQDSPRQMKRTRSS